MLFPSYHFIFMFLPLVVLLYYYLGAGRRNLLLTIASYVFYAYWDYRFCSLLLVSTLWDYWLGARISKSESHRVQKGFLLASLGLNLGLLGFFKYANFFIDSFAAVFPAIPASSLDIVLPVGISFFTFQSMSYPIDVYRKTVKPARSIIDFACYISMFPQLIAGPIVRYHQIAEQLTSRSSTIDDVAVGIRRFIIGLAKKVLIADTCAVVADTLFATPSPSPDVAWLAVMAFSLQIYFDFAGYSDMAIGLGRMFGFRLPENFRFPYQAVGLSDFWRRWHMSLSGWFRDYLYIPLGGSRCSWGRTFFNLVFTMLVCGLWHGAAWTFVLWGGYHGVLMALERPFRNRLAGIPRLISVPVTTAMVMIGWVLFRLESLDRIETWLRAMFGLARDPMAVSLPPTSLVVFVIGVQLACWLAPDQGEAREEPIRIGRDLAYFSLFLACVVAVLGASSSPFLYYQF